MIFHETFGRSSKFLRLPALRDALTQGSSTSLAAALVFVRAILIASLLEPQEFGILALMTLITSYVVYSDLGNTAAMEQRLPEAVARADEPKQREIVATGYAGKLLGSVVCSVGFLVYLAFWPPDSADLRFAIGSVILLVPLQALYGAQQARLRGLRKFNAVARLAICPAIVNLALGVPAAFFYGFKAVLISQILSAALAILFGSYLGAAPPLKYFSLRALGQGTLFGLPTAAILFAQYNLVNLDQVIVAHFINESALGGYSLVIAFGTMMYFIPTAIATVIAPRMLSAYAQSGDLGTLAYFAWRPTCFLRFFMLPLTVASLCTIWILLETVLVTYSEMIREPALIYVAGMYFLGVNLGPSSTLVALRKQAWSVPIVLSAVLVKLAFDLTAVSIGKLSLDIVAWGSVLAYGSYTVVNLAFIASQFQDDPRSIARTVAHHCWPGVMLVMLVFSASHFSQTLGHVYALLFVFLGSATLSLILFRRDSQFRSIPIVGDQS